MQPAPDVGSDGVPDFAVGAGEIKPFRIEVPAAPALQVGMLGVLGRCRCREGRRTRPRRLSRSKAAGVSDQTNMLPVGRQYALCLNDALLVHHVAELAVEVDEQIERRRPVHRRRPRHGGIDAAWLVQS